MAAPPQIAVFGPDPLLSVTIEAGGQGDEIHVHAAGQGAWVAHMAAEMGAAPVLCSLVGGETGAVLGPLLRSLPAELRQASMAGNSGSYVVDRRAGERSLVAASLRGAPQRHEIDDLVSITCAAAIQSGILVLCNPYPAQAFPLRCYEMIAADVRAAGVRLVVDLSSPRLERVLAFGPELVKLNDWELAEFVCGPVDGARAIDGVRRLQQAGARTVAVTRGEAPVLVVPERGEPYEIAPPALPSGFREGCGDAMTGAIAAALARGSEVPAALLLGTAAGSVNFLRHGLGSGRRREIEALARANVVRPLTSAQPGTAA